LFVLFAAFYLLGEVMLAIDDRVIEPLADVPESGLSVAIFGASGTAGDGILKAALASDNVATIQVVTRRVTPRMEEGAASGKLTVREHLDYLDYAAVINSLADVDAVYWAIGISTFKVDEETYGIIHVDFPTAFVEAWESVATNPARTFHYISSSDISEDSSANWAREKVRAEESLFAFADNSEMRVIAYRPDYIGPTEEEASLGQDFLHAFFAPVGAAVRARQIGQAMIDVTMRGDEIDNGTKIGTRRIILYSDAYEARSGN
jgi:nucleoside-diphosphate-sugar epimerase